MKSLSRRFLCLFVSTMSDGLGDVALCPCRSGDVVAEQVVAVAVVDAAERIPAPVRMFG